METDLDRMETAIQIFTKIETRIAVIENEVININKKIERMSKWKVVELNISWMKKMKLEESFGF